MATWFDLPAEIKVTIYQLIFSNQPVSLRQGSLITRRVPEYDAKKIFSILRVSKVFANAQEVVSALLASADIVLRRPWDFTKMKTLYPVEQTAMIRHLYLKTSKTKRAYEVHDRFDSFLSGKHSLSTHTPNLRSIWILWDAKEPNNDIIIRTGQLRPSHETFVKLIQPLETLSAPNVEYYHNVKRQLQEATRGLFEARPEGDYIRPWLGRLVSYALSHKIHLELKFVLILQYRPHSGYGAFDVLRIATFDIPPWRLRFRLEENGEEFSFSQNTMRRLFETQAVKL